MVDSEVPIALAGPCGLSQWANMLQMHLWEALMEEAPFRSTLVVLPPEADMEMTPSFSSIAHFVVGVQVSRGASRDFSEGSNSFKKSTPLLGPPCDEAFVGSVLPTTTAIDLPVV